LHQDLNRAPSLSLAEAEAAIAKVNPDVDEETSAALAWMGNLKSDSSFIVDLLQGQIRSSLRCSKCGHDWRHFDPFLYLSLPVTADMTKVTDAFVKFHQDETLTNGGEQLCPHCSSKVGARKKIKIWKLPPVLVLHLKRFAWDVDAGKFQKLTNTLAVPLELELSEYCASNQRHGTTYELCCVANHHGNYGHGHYAAACRVGGFDIGHEWFFFDDVRTTQITPEQAATMASKYGYVLFFMRTSERNTALGPKRQTVTLPESWPHVVPSLNSLVTRRDEEEAPLAPSSRGSRSSGSREKAPDRRTSTAADKELEAQLAKLTVGDQVMCIGLKPPAVGTVRFVGTASFSAGEWMGIELDEDVGKNDGSVLGVEYFKCRPQAGLFVRRSPFALRPVGTTPRKESSSKSLTPMAADRNLIVFETEVGELFSPRGFFGSQENLFGSARITVGSKAQMKEALTSCASEVDRLRSAVTRLGEAFDANQKVRPRCKFDTAHNKCYRETEEHRKEFCHPGESEWDSVGRSEGTPAWAAAGLQPEHKALLEKLLSEAGARLGKRLEEHIRQPLEQQVKSALASPLGKLRNVTEKVQELCPNESVHP